MRTTPEGTTRFLAVVFLSLSMLSSGSAFAAGTGQVSVDWSDNAEPDLDHYVVYRSTTLGGPYAQISPSAVTESEYLDTGLNDATTYYYVVTAVDAAGNASGYSDEASAFVVDATAPSVPLGLALAVVSATRLDLTWSASTDNVAVTGYRVFRDGVEVGTAAGTTYEDSGLTAGVEYAYTVAAYDAAGNESAVSDSVAAMATELVVHYAFDDGSGLIAEDASPVGVDATLRNGAGWTTGRVVGALQFDGVDDYAQSGSNSLADTLSDRFTVSFWMRDEGAGLQYLVCKGGPATGFYFATAADGTVEFSLSDGVNTFVARSDDSVPTDGSWRHVVVTVDGRSAVTLYVDSSVQSVVEGAALSSIGSVANSASLLIGARDGGLDAFQGRIDEVQIYNRALTAAEVEAMYDPGQPTGLVAISGDGVVSLDWDDNTEGDLTGYDLLRSTVSGGPYTLVAGSPFAASEHEDLTVTNGTAYYYVVRAVDSASLQSVESDEASATPADAVAPAAPTGLTANPL